MTKFELIYKRFLSKITDDMYIFLDKKDTIVILQEMLLNAICNFNYPKFQIEEYEQLEPVFHDEEQVIDGVKTLVREISDDSYFKADLSMIEMNIIAELMVLEWINQQLFKGDLVSQLYTGSESRKDSQANHIAKLESLRKNWEGVCIKTQFEYSKKDKDSRGFVKSTFGDINKTTGGNIDADKDPFYSFRRF